MINDFALSRLRRMGGRTLTAIEADDLRSQVAGVPEELVSFMVEYPVVDAYLSIPEDKDASEMGVDMQWLSAKRILREVVDAYPGIVAVSAGYIPIGACTAGSGDPYFYRVSDGAVVRILHEPGEDPDRLSESNVEFVAPSLTCFVELACTE